MNANEVAKSIEITDALNIADHLSRGQYDWCPEAEWVLREQHDKLRLQQTEIEVLKLQLHTTLTNRDLRTYDGKLDIANEPVAWIDKRTSKCVVFINTPPSDNWIPLYTQPAKELTEAEIEQILKQHDWYSKTWVDMVRSIESAILRKAQEK